jgi:hypothetical protein
VLIVSLAGVIIAIGVYEIVAIAANLFICVVPPLLSLFPCLRLEAILILPVSAKSINHGSLQCF